MPDPSTALVVKAAKIAAALHAKLEEHAAKNDAELRKQRMELALEFSAEVKGALPVLVQMLANYVDDLEARIAPILADHQTRRIYDNYRFEAAREAIDERRRMLAHAAAGLIDPELSVSQKARVERTLRELDPEDVMVLYAANLVAGKCDIAPMREPLPTPRPSPNTLPRGWYRSVDGTRRAFLERTPEFDHLVAAGCVAVDRYRGNGLVDDRSASLTRLGKQVLRVLRSYVVSRPLPLQVPGREFEAGDRAEDDARTVLAALPELADAIRGVCRLHPPAHVEYQHRTPERDGRAVLQAFIYDWGAVRPRLESLQAELDGSELRIELTEQPFQPPPGGLYDLHDGADYNLLRLRLSGPHDLLRWLADDCRVPWS